MARIYEYQGKDILKKFGISVPRGRCVTSPKEAAEAARQIGKPVVVKAQVWVTGRFKAGGIHFVKTPEEAKETTRELLACEIKGLPVSRVLVEEQLEVARELYVGIVVNNSYKVKGPVLIFSSEGGTSIEEVAKRNPEKVGRLNVDYLKGTTHSQIRQLLSDVSFNGDAIGEPILVELGRIAEKVYQAFKKYDARSVEINPLILTSDGRVIAADCHFNIDDNSVFLHPEFNIVVPRDMERPPTELEKKAWLTIEEGDYRGTGYFTQMVPNYKGKGWLGFHGIGGGGAMLGAAAFVQRGFKIANYADTSGDPPASKIYCVIKYILSLPIDGYVLMGATLANQEQWHHAHALVKAFKEEEKKRPGFPVIALLAGNKESESHEIIHNGFKNLSLRWELYGKDYIYNTDFIADRVETLIKAYQDERKK
jgi:succinyl-CoA synthetase beta subunit